MVTIVRAAVHGAWQCRRPRAPHYHRFAGRTHPGARYHALFNQALAVFFACHRLHPAHSSWSRR